MFDLSFAEMLVVAVVGLVVLGPKELPKVARTIRGWIRQLRGASQTLRDQVNDVLDADEFDFITGDDGKRYRRYIMPDLVDEDSTSSPPTRDVNDG